jgi:hypothetical protein
MVIVLAALYSIYRSRNMGAPAAEPTNDDVINAEEQQHAEGGRRSRQRRNRQQQSSSASPSASPSATSLRDDFTATLKRSGSAIYQTAILRCSPSGAAGMTTTTTISTDENVSSTEEDDASILFPLQKGCHSSRSCNSSNNRINSATPNNAIATGTSSTTNVEPPPDSVKQEWIDVIFGNDFLISPNSSKSGESPSGQYQTANIVIPEGYYNPKNETKSKVGVTISRLAVGIYVKSVVPGSEAALSGIRPMSILISINDLPVLAEPSRQLLERIWQYEGYFCNSNKNALLEETYDPTFTNRIVSNTTSSTSNNIPAPNGRIHDPVVLKFVHQRQIYSVILLSNPFWGIQWASAAPNMPLVKRVYSIAAEVGLRKGSIVTAVNGRTLRDMDHVQTALHIRDLFENGEAIHISTAFPPVTARASYYERSVSAVSERRIGQPPGVIESKPLGQHDGVHVKFLPLGYAIGSLCASEKNVFYEDRNCFTEQSVSEFAQAVSSGNAEPPIPNRLLLTKCLTPSSYVYPPCPTLSSEQLLDGWDPLQALIFCLRFQRAVTDEVDLTEQSNSIIKSRNPIEILHDLTSGPAGADIAGAFLLQFISVICSPDQFDDQQNAQHSSKRNANEITSLLLKLSRKNESFCQRLYFLLRSYISTFETSKPQQDGDSRNLMALLNCLELLRFAENELAGRTISTTTTESTPIKREHSLDCSGSVMFETSISGLELRSANDALRVPPESPTRDKIGRLRFLKKSPKRSPSRSVQPDNHINNVSIEMSDSLSLVQTPSMMYENMSDVLTELDKICATIERSLQKSFRQKIADWALQPWSAGKDAALAEVTSDMRQSLEASTIAARNKMLLVNPVESSELLSSVDCNECYILPSAHFPILLTFNVSERRCSDSIVGEERLYRTRVDILSLKSAARCEYSSFSVEGAITGSISKSGDSTSASLGATHHTWHRGGFLMFETRSSTGAPQTLSVRVSGESDTFDKRGNVNSEVGFCWIDLSEQWKHGAVSEYSSTKKVVTNVWPMTAAACKFDSHGDLFDECINNPSNRMQLEVRITTESLELDSDDDNTESTSSTRKRMLLYKHDDDLRQEAFAIHFIKTCSDILKISGLDMKLLTFQCIPVGTRRGFVEWVPGSAPLSEICHPFNNISRSSSTIIRSAQHTSNNHDSNTSDNALIHENRSSSVSPIFRNGPSKYGSLRRLGGQPNEKLRRLAIGSKAGPRGSIANDPIQDFLRSVAYDANAPYMIRRDVMDTYVKSCAGYSIITYILGVGDRHLDNLLLHQSGSFFHCDYSFILGSDPKKYLPMRITEDMVYGMGYKDSDNYAKFLSLMSAAFLALRRPENVRVILSTIRLMKESYLPDVSVNQTIEQAIFGVRERLRLDLSESDAIDYIENLVEESLSNKLWIAVDAIHHIGKTF